MKIADTEVRKLDLRDNEDEREISPHRPLVRVSIEASESIAGPGVALSISALWGQNQRFIELTPQEAVTLARLLNDAVDDCIEIRKETA